MEKRWGTTTQTHSGSSPIAPNHIAANPLSFQSSTADARNPHILYFIFLPRHPRQYPNDNEYNAQETQDSNNEHIFELGNSIIVNNAAQCEEKDPLGRVLRPSVDLA